jgi:hypothetical protein
MTDLWQVRLEQLHIMDADEDGILSDGDEPYLVAIGFRSRFKTPDSTQVFWGEMLDDDWGNSAKAGQTKNIPSQMGVLAFPNVALPTLADLQAGVMPEIVGAVVIAMESDATPFGDVRDEVHKLEGVMRGQLVNLIERGNIDLSDPRKSIQQAVRAITDALKPSVGEALVEWLRSFTDPDDLVGIVPLVFGAADPSLAGAVNLPLLTEQPLVLDFPGDGVHYQVSGRTTKLGWAHGVPGDVSDVPVAAGTSPTSWYTTPENVQHIGFVGTDQRIHELFFFVGPNGSWAHGIPGAVSDVPVAPGTSPTSWYTTPENVQHIAYVGTDQKIHELFFFIGRGDGMWHHNVPGDAADVLVAPGTSPTSWYTTPENVQHIAYVGTDRRIHELFFFVGPDGRWMHGVPGNASDTLVAEGTSPTSWYTTPENVQHIGFAGTDQRIHELFFFVGPNGSWAHGVPGAVSDVPVAPGTSPTSWYTTPENVQHIGYVGTDHKIHELFFFVGPNGSWAHGVPGDAADVLVADGTSPTSWYTTPENVQHIGYVGTDRRIHELFFFVGPNGRWMHGVPGDASGTAVAEGTNPTSWYTTPENVQHIAYAGTDRKLHELFYFIR